MLGMCDFQKISRIRNADKGAYFHELFFEGGLGYRKVNLFSTFVFRAIILTNEYQVL